jgi:hypothetical protein
MSPSHPALSAQALEAPLLRCRVPVLRGVSRTDWAICPGGCRAASTPYREAIDVGVYPGSLNIVLGQPWLLERPVVRLSAAVVESTCGGAG